VNQERQGLKTKKKGGKNRQPRMEEIMDTSESLIVGQGGKKKEGVQLTGREINWGERTNREITCSKISNPKRWKSKTKRGTKRERLTSREANYGVGRGRGNTKGGVVEKLRVKLETCSKEGTGWWSGSGGGNPGIGRSGMKEKKRSNTEGTA